MGFVTRSAWVWFTVAALILFVTGVHKWNHNSVSIAPEVDLSRVVIGTTTVDQFTDIIGGGKKFYSCTKDQVVRYIRPDSWLTARGVEICGNFRSHNGGDADGRARDDGDCQIVKIEINTYNRYTELMARGDVGNRIWRFLEWEYRNF